MYFEQVTTPGLGCFSYLLGCPLAGVMAVVDPKRDIEVYLELSRRHGMKITHIFDTHVHADHISGARELGRATGADIYIHESAPVGYQAKKVRHNDSFSFGAAHIRVLHTPGHTPNSISLLVTDTVRSDQPQMILTGDLLFVGDTGRPDLPGEQILREQIQNLFDSLNKTLGELPDGLEVYPAHGQGSLCGGGMSAKPHSTLGYERIANHRLRLKDFAAFSESILSQLPMRPQSFSHIIATNLDGAPLLPLCETARPALSAGAVEELQKDGATVLDLRNSLAYAGAHIPGSLHVDATQPQAPNWIGTVVPPKTRLVLVLDADGDFEQRLTELRRIGYDEVLGWLEGGMTAWINQGKAVESLRTISPGTLKDMLSGAGRPQLIDVRTNAEVAQFSLPGSMHVSFEKLLGEESCPGSDNEERVVLCQTGYRSAIAAALLQSRGCKNLSMLAGGINAYRKDEAGA
ncbi:MBL fold metallo-hydrolase [Desulfovibrio sp. OttesenSCG-928-A18]|nr:MBL fold metallo-hydrolase [Desulfovibrio sp. OttesenSCG-928-A18]